MLIIVILLLAWLTLVINEVEENGMSFKIEKSITFRFGQIKQPATSDELEVEKPSNLNK